MLAATPANGGHYLVDIIAGVAIAIAAIVAARAVGRFIVARQGASAFLDPALAILSIPVTPAAVPAE